MRRKFSPIEITIGILIAIGLLVSLRIYSFLFLCLGRFFYLYKFPPSRWKKLRFIEVLQKVKRKTPNFVLSTALKIPIR